MEKKFRLTAISSDIEIWKTVTVSFENVSYVKKYNCTYSLTLVVVKFHILTTIIIQIKCLSFYGDTLNLYFYTDCIMILWSSQSTMIVSWYNGFQYQKWKRHEMGLFSCTFHASMILDMCTECIMILSSSESTLNVSWYNQG